MITNEQLKSSKLQAVGYSILIGLGNESEGAKTNTVCIISYNFTNPEEMAAELVRRWNCHEELLAGCQKFVRWVDACWGASEILHTDTLKEYQDAKEAIKEATNE